MEKTVETRTMSVVLNELNDSVDKYNLATDAIERAQLAAKHKELVQEYNELSLLNAYAGFMADANPIIALAKAYYYDTISVKDTVHNEVVEGVKKSTVTRSVNEGNKKFDVAKFVEWTEERNKSVAANKDWKDKVSAARNSIASEWKKFFTSNKDSHSMSIGKTKRAVQAMFDSLVFIKSESGKNAVIADGDVARWALGFANNRKDSKDDNKQVVISGNVLPDSTWRVIFLDVLHKAAEGKKFDIIYGEPEDDNAKPKTKAKPEAEAEAEAEA